MEIESEGLEIYHYKIDEEMIPFKMYPNVLRDWEFRTAVDPEPLEKIMDEVRNNGSIIINALQNFPKKKDGTFCKNRYIVIGESFVTHKIKKYGFPIGKKQLIRITYEYDMESFRIDLVWEPEYFKNKKRWKK